MELQRQWPLMPLHAPVVATGCSQPLRSPALPVQTETSQPSCQRVSSGWVNPKDLSRVSWNPPSLPPLSSFCPCLFMFTLSPLVMSHILHCLGLFHIIYLMSSIVRVFKCVLSYCSLVVYSLHVHILCLFS